MADIVMVPESNGMEMYTAGHLNRVKGSRARHSSPRLEIALGRTSLEPELCNIGAAGRGSSPCNYPTLTRTVFEDHQTT